MSENKNSDKFQLRMPSDIKAEIKQSADMAGVSMAAYMIECATSKDKIVILNKSGEIAKALTEIVIHTEHSLRGKDITTELERRILSVLEEVSYKLSVILDEITIMHNGESDGDV
ncbi:MAG: hypothetical protein NC320_12435 [Clostridium sp.]|nr:hypothetical protein [Clostridium sp.]